MPRHVYLSPSHTAGYSGFVVYYNGGDQVNIWMIPGTFFCDWDN